jgi:Family of unknown function (DUF6510)
MSQAPLDGNAAAGDLTDVFTFDVTTAVTTCAGCHDTHPVATLHAYLRAPGMVLRCASCDAVQLRYVRSSQRAWLDTSGIDMLAIPWPVTIDSMTDGVTSSRTDEATT